MGIIDSKRYIQIHKGLFLLEIQAIFFFADRFHKQNRLSFYEEKKIDSYWYPNPMREVIKNMC